MSNFAVTAKGITLHSLALANSRKGEEGIADFAHRAAFALATALARHPGANPAVFGAVAAAEIYSGACRSEKRACGPEKPRLLSDALRLVASVGPEGRHYVARRAVAAGELLLEEAAFAWAVAADDAKAASSRCAYCLEKTLQRQQQKQQQQNEEGNLSASAGRSLFCSAACEAAAEASWLPAVRGRWLLASLPPEVFLALHLARRIDQESGSSSSCDNGLAGSGSSNGDNKCCSNREPTRVSGCDADGSYAGGATSAAALQAHVAGRSEAELVLQGVEAALAVIAAEMPPRIDWVNRIMHAMAQVRTNSFAIASAEDDEVEEDDDGGSSAAAATAGLCHRRRGVGVFPTAALFNHSCQPSAFVSFDCGGGAAPRLTVTALRDVPAGAAVTISYGPLASRESSKAARRDALRRSYLFDCNCVACQRDAGTHSGFEWTEGKATELRCPNCNGNCGGELFGYSSKDAGVVKLSCNGCGTTLPEAAATMLLAERRQWSLRFLAARTALFGRGKEIDNRVNGRCSGSGSDSSKSDESSRINKGEKGINSRGDALKELLRCLAWRQQRCPPHSRALGEAYDAAVRAYVDAGDFVTALPLMRQALESLSHRFSDCDPEMGRERVKLAGILLMSGKPAECLQEAARARKGLYGDKVSAAQLAAVEEAAASFYTEGHRGPQ